MDNAELIGLAKIHAAVKDPDVAHLVIGLNKVITSNTVPGLEVEVVEKSDEVRIGVYLKPEVRVAKPVHMCFGLVQEAGIQKINLDLNIERDSAVDIIAHCVFPNATDVQHLMDAQINIAANARYTYFERHIHSPAGGITVVPKAVVELGSGARFKTDFELIQGRVGVIDIDYTTTCRDHSVMEMVAKVSGRGDDVIKIRETGHLIGEYARGALLSRVAVRDRARADVYNRLTASAAHARGHVDCKEIILDDGVASATPIVEVNHPKAHVTHEAALGSVDTKQLETLMSRGLSEDEASDLIVAGLLT
ncbi:MAG: SufBD protein [Phycisphaerae bacterium]|nr:SufBD protein [Phycisphaerae bacterium]